MRVMHDLISPALSSTFASAVSAEAPTSGAGGAASSAAVNESARSRRMRVSTVVVFMAEN